MRLIDADVLNLYKATHSELIEEIEDAPTVEPKHGKWIENDGVDFGLAECSCCKWVANDALCWVEKEYIYCPNCGAKMR